MITDKRNLLTETQAYCKEKEKHIITVVIAYYWAFDKKWFWAPGTTKGLRAYVHVGGAKWMT